MSNYWINVMASVHLVSVSLAICNLFLIILYVIGLNLFNLRYLVE